ncbi:MAG: hypothetical protein Q8J97_07365, partial [Flavobacteriaceae bacterium]|nr:hypothetical protein [Flavobacteriaceae bacterium]
DAASCELQARDTHLTVTDSAMTATGTGNLGVLGWLLVSGATSSVELRDCHITATGAQLVVEGTGSDTVAGGITLRGAAIVVDAVSTSITARSRTSVRLVCIGASAAIGWAMDAAAGDITARTRNMTVTIADSTVAASGGAVVAAGAIAAQASIASASVSAEDVRFTARASNVSAAGSGQAVIAIGALSTGRVSALNISGTCLLDVADSRVSATATGSLAAAASLVSSSTSASLAQTGSVRVAVQRSSATAATQANEAYAAAFVANGNTAGTKASMLALQNVQTLLVDALVTASAVSQGAAAGAAMAFGLPQVNASLQGATIDVVRSRINAMSTAYSVAVGLMVVVVASLPTSGGARIAINTMRLTMSEGSVVGARDTYYGDVMAGGVFCFGVYDAASCELQARDTHLTVTDSAVESFGPVHVSALSFHLVSQAQVVATLSHHYCNVVRSAVTVTAGSATATAMAVFVRGFS